MYIKTLNKHTLTWFDAIARICPVGWKHVDVIGVVRFNILFNCFGWLLPIVVLLVVVLPVVVVFVSDWKA